MAEIVRLSMTEHRQVEPGGFIRTETAANILLSLRLIQSLDGPAMTMVAGAPGVGKTRTMRFIADEIGDQGSVYLSVAKGEGNPWNLATALLGMWNVSQLGNDLTRARQNLADCIGPRRFLLIDEAQHLDQKHKKTGERGAGFEWLRALAEEAGCRMVLCGDLTLAPMIDAFPQLQSRMRRPVIIKAASKADVAAIAGVSGIRSDAAIEALYHVARHRGGLRNVENVLRMAELFANGATPNEGHLLEAIKDLNLAPKGAR
jgi:DNA transposition AAA+ family ATPase